jgi:hypothetical protein
MASSSGEEKRDFIAKLKGIIGQGEVRIEEFVYL